MTSTDPVSSKPVDTTQIYSSDPNTMGKDDFLMLLVTELQNQDPLEPMDNSDFVAQLAQFSSLEQLTNANKNLEVLQMYGNSLNNAQAVGMIGKNIMASGNTTELEEGADAAVEFNLPANAADVSIDIFNAGGSFVTTLQAGAMGAGHHSMTWNGTNSDAESVPAGIYMFEVHAVDENDVPLETGTYTEGLVTGVTYRKGTPYLVTGENLVPLAAVREVTNPGLAPEPADPEGEEGHSER
jgi:flagellar basal-body rod modification protein FlgD